MSESPALSRRWLGSAAGIGRRLIADGRALDLAVVLSLAVLLWITRFARMREFGLYEDDLTLIPMAVQFSPGELFGFLVDYFAGLRGHLRPISDSLIVLFSWLGWRLGGLPGIYVLGWGLTALNAALFYGLVRRRFDGITAMAAGAAYALFSGDTTQAFLTHSLGLQPSLTLAFVGLHAYLSGRRWLTYVLGGVLLFSYEVPFPLLLAAPVLHHGFTRRGLRDTPLHVGALLAMLAAVAWLRLAVEDDRVAGLSLASAPTIALRQMLSGPWVSLGSFVLRPLQFLRLVSVDGVVIAVGTLLVVWGLLTWARHVRQDGVEASILDRRSTGDLLRSLALGGLLLLLAYPLTFTTRPTAISGRETRVHLAAGVGASVVVGGATAGVVASLRRRRGGEGLATAAAAGGLALLAGFGSIVQQDYVDAWRLQREFWQALLPQIQDAGEGVVIIVDPSGLKDPLQIGANSWNLPRVLP